MQIAGLVLLILGGVLVFASAFALSCIQKDGEETIPDLLVEFTTFGSILFVSQFFRGVLDGIRNRSSPAFPLVILLAVATGMVVAGVLLI